MSCYVYVLSAEGRAYKLGVSRRPERRRRDLQTSHYRKLSVLYAHEFVDRASAVAEEQWMHRQLSAWHVRGEWFSPGAEDALVRWDYVIGTASRIKADVQESLESL